MGTASPSERILSLARATQEIFSACSETSEFGRPPPFFFAAGAGISAPTVPLARDIISHCKSISTEIELELGVEGMLSEYSRCFSSAYPHAIQRQRYLKSLISGKAISQANLRLAHLLSDAVTPAVTDLVATTNFDDFLSRALSVFGRKHSVCDHPVTTARIELNDSSELKVVHVHGSYRFYDCKNLANEVSQTAAGSAISAANMASFLDAVLKDRSPLVIGYAGWDGDVFMGSLRRRLLHQAMPYNVYWFCYRASDLEVLPIWLREHESVRFILPEGAKAHSTENALQARSETPVLHAQVVFEQMLKTFRAEPPKIATDPLGAYYSQLAETLPLEDSLREGQSDLYSWGVILERVKESQRVYASAYGVAGAGAVRRMDELRFAMRSVQYEKVVELGAQLFAEDFSLKVKLELAELLVDANDGLRDAPFDVRTARWLSLVEWLNARRHESNEFALSYARATFQLASVHLANEKTELGLSGLAGLIDELEGEPLPQVIDEVAKARLLLGRTLEQKGDTGAAAAQYDGILKLKEPSPGSLMVQIIGEAAIASLFIQEGAGDLVGALRRGAEFIALPWVREDSSVLSAMLYVLGMFQERAGDVSQALKTLLDIELRFAGHHDPSTVGVAFVATAEAGRLQLAQGDELGLPRLQKTIGAVVPSSGIDVDQVKRASLLRVLDYLREKGRSAEGLAFVQGFLDFYKRPGAFSDWVTPFVGFALAEIALSAGFAGAEEQMHELMRVHGKSTNEIVLEMVGRQRASRDYAAVLSRRKVKQS